MKNMDSTQQVCYEVLKGAQMGIDAIDELLKCCDDKEFKNVLLSTQNDYKEVAHEADVLLQENGGIPRELPAKIRMMTWSMVKGKTIGDNSPARLSEMMLKGMKMADEEMKELIKQNPEAIDSSIRLAGRLLKMQNKHRGFYESYLKK